MVEPLPATPLLLQVQPQQPLLFQPVYLGVYLQPRPVLPLDARQHIHSNEQVVLGALYRKAVQGFLPVLYQCCVVRFAGLLLRGGQLAWLEQDQARGQFPRTLD